MPIKGLASGKLTAPWSSQQFNPTCQAHCADPPSIGGKMTGAGRLPLDVVAAGVVCAGGGCGRCRGCGRGHRRGAGSG